MGGKKTEDADSSDQYGEKYQYDPSFRGPVRKRSCTDIICCAIFGVFIAGYIVVGLLAWLYGDPRQVIYPRNSTGSYCGIGNNRGKPYLLYFNLINCITDLNPLTVAMKGVQCPTTQICVSNCSDKFWVVLPTDLIPTKKPFGVWNQALCQPSIDLKTTNLTVSEILNQQLCPEFTIPTKPLINRCFPALNYSEIGKFQLPGMTQNETVNNITTGTEQLLSSLSVKDISVKIFEDLTRTWYWILIGLLLAMMLSLLFLLLLRFIAGILVWVLIVGVVVITAYGIYHCYMEYDILNKQGATIQTIGFTTNFSLYGSVKETWLAALIVLCVVEGILLLTLLFLRKRIFTAIALIQEASRAIGYMMSTLVYPLLTFVLLLVCVAYWAMTALYPF